MTPTMKQGAEVTEFSDRVQLTENPSPARRASIAANSIFETSVRIMILINVTQFSL